MIVMGANFLGHDRSIAVVDRDQLLFHGRLEDNGLKQALEYKPNLISYYERPWLKKTRELYSGNWSAAISQTPKQFLADNNIDIPIIYQPHHKSHAATGYFKSNFVSADVYVIDAIGEWDCTSVWLAEGNYLKKIYSEKYPYSLGLFYSSFTKLLGFKPNGQEHLLYNLSLTGDPYKHINSVARYLDKKINLHRGVADWKVKASNQDIAASVQYIFEKKIEDLIIRHKKNDHAVVMGGCAMNAQVPVLFNKFYKKSYTYKPSGDFSSSIGAAILANPIRLK